MYFKIKCKSNKVITGLGRGEKKASFCKLLTLQFHYLSPPWMWFANVLSLCHHVEMSSGRAKKEWKTIPWSFGGKKKEIKHLILSWFSLEYHFLKSCSVASASESPDCSLEVPGKFYILYIPGYFSFFPHWQSCSCQSQLHTYVRSHVSWTIIFRHICVRMLVPKIVSLFTFVFFSIVSLTSLPDTCRRIKIMYAWIQSRDLTLSNSLGSFFAVWWH